MKIYLDSGVFIDYFIGRAQAGAVLRRTGRRGRAPYRLLTDAETCFAALGSSHVGITSTLTCYEVEEALYRALALSPTRLPGEKQLVLESSRATISQMLVTLGLFNIDLVDLTRDVIAAVSANHRLVISGVRAADAVHITTALAEAADLFITTDGRILKLDAEFRNAAGSPLRCVDTDAAIRSL